MGVGEDLLRNELLAYWSRSPETVTVSALVQQRNKLKAKAIQTYFHLLCGIDNAFTFSNIDC